MFSVVQQFLLCVRAVQKTPVCYIVLVCSFKAPMIVLHNVIALAQKVEWFRRLTERVIVQLVRYFTDKHRFLPDDLFLPATEFCYKRILYGAAFGNTAITSLVSILKPVYYKFWSSWAWLFSLKNEKVTALCSGLMLLGQFCSGSVLCHFPCGPVLCLSHLVWEPHPSILEREKVSSRFISLPSLLVLSILFPFGSLATEDVSEPFQSLVESRHRV